MRALFPALLALVGATVAHAQDRAGNDTPGEWIVDHSANFGPWDSFCDHRVTGDLREERCYLRLVDVFSPRPRFAAAFVFVTPGPVVDFGLEPGTLMQPGDFRITRDGVTAWDQAQPGCLVGLACRYEGKEATFLFDQMTEGGTFRLDLIDRHGQAHQLEWPLDGFAAARADFEAEAAARGLTGE